MGFSPGRDGGSLPSAIADGYGQRWFQSPGGTTASNARVAVVPPGLWNL